MAFQNQTPAATGGNNDAWKSDAFVNIWLTLPDGSKRKLGFIGLKKSKNFEKAIIDRLNEGGDDAFKAFVNLLAFDYQLADGKPVDAESLGF